MKFEPNNKYNRRSNLKIDTYVYIFEKYYLQPKIKKKNVVSLWSEFVFIYLLHLKALVYIPKTQPRIKGVVKNGLNWQLEKEIQQIHKSFKGERINYK